MRIIRCALSLLGSILLLPLGCEQQQLPNETSDSNPITSKKTDAQNSDVKAVWINGEIFIKSSSKEDPLIGPFVASPSKDRGFVYFPEERHTPGQFRIAQQIYREGPDGGWYFLDNYISMKPLKIHLIDYPESN
ncbi:MAG: hypothetical protein ACSHYB_02870 [Roseibacillus sp.]